jgi:hypothetical protein
MPRQCDLLSNKLVERALIAAIDKMNPTLDVTVDTEIRSARDLNMDPEDVQDRLLPIILKAVANHGCRLISFGPTEIKSCETVGEIIAGVWKDLDSPPAVRLYHLSNQLSAGKIE